MHQNCKCGGTANVMELPHTCLGQKLAFYEAATYAHSPHLFLNLVTVLSQIVL